MSCKTNSSCDIHQK